MDSELAYGLQQRRDPGKPRHATYARAETEGLGSDQISETALKSDGLANRPAFAAWSAMQGVRHWGDLATLPTYLGLTVAGMVASSSPSFAFLSLHAVQRAMPGAPRVYTL